MDTSLIILFSKAHLPFFSLCSICSLAFPPEESSKGSLILFAAQFLQQLGHKLFHRL